MRVSKQVLSFTVKWITLPMSLSLLFWNCPQDQSQSFEILSRFFFSFWVCLPISPLSERYKERDRERQRDRQHPQRGLKATIHSSLSQPRISSTRTSARMEVWHRTQPCGSAFRVLLPHHGPTPYNPPHQSQLLRLQKNISQLFSTWAHVINKLNSTLKELNFATTMIFKGLCHRLWHNT